MTGLSHGAVHADDARVFGELLELVRVRDEFYRDIMTGFAEARTLLEIPAERRTSLVLLLAETYEAHSDASAKVTHTWASADYRICSGCSELLAHFLPAAVRGRPDAIDALCAWQLRKIAWTWKLGRVSEHLLKAIEVHAKNSALTGVMSQWLSDFRVHQQENGKKSVIGRIDKLLGVQLHLKLEPGEPWADAVIDAITKAPDATRGAWMLLIDHCLAATGAAPSATWSRQARTQLTAIGREHVERSLLDWFPLVDRPRTGVFQRGYVLYEVGSPRLIDHHMDVLRGLCWLAGVLGGTEIARATGKLAISAYRKVPGVGPRAVKVGNAAVHALGQMPGPDALGQLAMLKVKVKFIPAQKGIEKALTAAAIREGLPRAEIEELAVPSYGLTDVGILEEPMGDFIARVTVDPAGGAGLAFVKADGKTVKSVPAAIKESHAEELNELKAAMKDIAVMVPAQKDRIDSLFLARKVWPFKTWRERYLDHPLVGVLGRRLIWTIAEGQDRPRTAVTWTDGELRGVDGGVLNVDEATAIVRIWHPMEATTETVLAWRKHFEDREIQQPFKQAHREIYVLTDAERRTNTYSNRYAAHVLRQHQFHALCGARGSRNQLRLLVDDEFPPASRALAEWGLRAEFWIEGAGDNFGVDTNEAGTFLHLTTDQVRFYRVNAAQAHAHASGGGYSTVRINDMDAPLARPGQVSPDDPIPLTEVPPLVFSEVMRDVDLFVGVASVGNNPAWQDGGPDNRFREYWWHYGFGELSGTAQTRRELLGRLVPRLKIAGVCELSDKFLIVQGRLRTYKIHLGSGNILMKPNDEYLCIVPGSRDDAGIHLPFDGDRTLSIILSKAFMLAADDQIKDPSIVSQIKKR